MSPHRTRAGVILGCSAILLWSTSSVGTVWVGSKAGPWQFLAIAGLIAGIAQVLLYRRMKMPLKQILLPPLKLWWPILLCFVLYMLVYTHAMVSAAPVQTVGVSLANYLWPTLTVVLAVVLVPGTRMTVRLLAAMALALAGLVLANFEGLSQLLKAGSKLSVWPYVLGLAAAVSWAVYSAILARWRDWANQYATAPIGFLLTGVLAGIVCARSGLWEPMDAGAWVGVAFMGLGPWGAGYLLWELALHRAPAGTLGLLASATPVLSTVWLLVMFHFTGGGQSTNGYLVLMLSAGMIGCAVLIGAYKSNGKKPPTTSVDHEAARRDAGCAD